MRCHIAAQQSGYAFRVKFGWLGVDELLA